ncbi:MAG: hypothetical protein HYW77_01570 [Parcubacteria group bacterium]|nr:hypothetical protein [Parcubacteria group bacterium]
MNKRVILPIIVLVTSLIFWGVVQRSIQSPNLKEVIFWVKVALSFGLFSGSLAFGLLLSNSKYWAALNIFIPILVFWFLTNLGLITLVLGLLVFLIQFSYYTTIKSEQEQRLKVSIKKFLEKGIYGFIAGIIILVTLFYYFTPSVQEKSRQITIPKSLETFVQEFTTQTLLRNASPEVRAQIQTPEFQTQLGQEVQRTTKELLRQLDSWAGPYKKFFPLVLSIGFYLTLTAFTFLWNWLTLLFASLFLFIFKQLGLVKINSVQKEAEELELVN